MLVFVPNACLLREILVFCFHSKTTAAGGIECSQTLTMVLYLARENVLWVIWELLGRWLRINLVKVMRCIWWSIQFIKRGKVNLLLGLKSQKARTHTYSNAVLSFRLWFVSFDGLCFDWLEFSISWRSEKNCSIYETNQKAMSFSGAEFMR